METKVYGSRYNFLRRKRYGKGKAEKEKRRYKCGFCGFEFSQWVDSGYSEGGEADKSEYHDPSKCSSQVKCPKCDNFLKTWSDGDG